MAPDASDAGSRPASGSISEVGWLALLLAVLAVSWGSILARLCDSPSLTIGLYRLLFATLMVAPWGIPAMRAPRVRSAGLLAALGAGVMLALHFATWITSLAYTSIASSTLLVSVQPVFSIVRSGRLLRERAGARTWRGTLLAFAGVALVAGADRQAGEGRWLGDLLALLGALAAAAYFVIGRAARKEMPFPAWLLAVNLSAMLLAGLLALLAGSPIVPTTRGDLPWLLLMALVPHVIGHGLLNWSVRRLRAYVVNLAILGEPILASLYAVFIFREIPGPAFYAGALLIGAGVVMAVAAESRREPLPADL